MKERLLCDSAFLAKLAVEAGMGVVTKIVAELEKRPDKFLAELDLVLANTIMSLISDIMLIWIPAPRANVFGPAVAVSEQPALRTPLGSVYQFCAGCPANIFQVWHSTLASQLPLPPLSFPILQPLPFCSGQVNEMSSCTWSTSVKTLALMRCFV